MTQSEPRGAYGIALEGRGAAHPSLPVAPPGWPLWSLEWSPDGESKSSGGGQRYPVAGGGEVHIEPEPQRVTVVGIPEPTDAALMHPWLAFIGTIVAQHRGLISFHGGGVQHRGATWGVLGAKHAGKTSTLAWLSRQDCLVTSDDLIVLDGATSLAGPGCLDLRSGAADHLLMGARETLLPGRDRWRAWLPTPPAESPFAGFVIPKWHDGDGVLVEEVHPLERLRVVAESRAFLATTGHERLILALSAAPMIRWSRPRDFARLDEAGQALIRALAQHGRPAARV